MLQEKNTKRLAALFLVLFAGMAFSEYGQGVISFEVTDTTPIVNITNVEFSPDEIVQGSSSDVSVFLENTGGTAANTTVNVTIYFSNGSVADVLEYDATVVSVGGTLQLTKTYETDSRPLGTYTANATGYYTFNSTDYTTNTYTTTFEIIATPPGGGGGSGSSGSGQDIFPLPTIFPPIIKQIPGAGLEFSKSTVLKEVRPGANAVEDIVLKNTENEEKLIKFNTEKAPWIRPRREQFIMLANEEQSLNLLIDIPNDAKPGDYLAEISMESQDGTARDFMAIRVKPKMQTPAATKTITLDRRGGFTLVKIEVENPTDQVISKIIVQEEIPRALTANKDKVYYVDRPGEVVDEVPLTINWVFNDLLPQETDTISYQINTLLGEYSDYVYWPIKQVIIPSEITFETLVRVVELHAPVFSPGEEKEITARVYYTGLEPMPVSASLLMPENFRIEPESIERVLQPASFSNFVFKVKAPEGRQGTFIATFSLNAQQGRLERTTTLILAAPNITDNSFLYIAGGIAVIVLLAIIFALRGKGNGMERDEIEDIIDRETYLNEVKGILKKGRP